MAKPFRGVINLDCPGARHAPHHAPKEWIDRYRGRFDMGYEVYWELVFERQNRCQLVAAGTTVAVMCSTSGALGVDDAAKSDVAGRGVDGLALARGGAVAQAVVGGAQVRAPLDDPTRDMGAGGGVIVALIG